jgi:serine/threonine-protein kinase
MVMHEHPAPLATVRGDLPPGFSDAVGRCLEKDPQYRYPNIAELAYALAAYAADPHRALHVADRIAATLSVAQMPRSIEMPLPSMPIAAPSNPRSGASSVGSMSQDTGTASPWTGTQSGGRVEPRNGLIWAAMALVATLGVGGIYAKIRHDRAQEAVAAAAAEAVRPVIMAQPTVVQPVVLPQQPLVQAVASAQPETEAPAAAPPVVAVNAPSVSPSSLPSVAAELPRGRTFVATARKPVRPAGNSPSSPPKTGDGIPSTRD